MKNIQKQIQKGLCAFIACIALTAFGLQTAQATVFSNPASITINDLTSATPYPSGITVSGMSGTLTNVNVTLASVNHTWASDIRVLLVGPGGQTLVIMAAVGGSTGFDATSTVTLSDAGAGLMPTSGALSGTYRPTDYSPGQLFVAPAPAGPYGQAATAGAATLNGTFGGIVPNGTWNLYVVDGAGGDVGTIGGGWSLDITSAVICPPNTFLWSTVTLPGNNVVVPFSTCNFSGDYNVINGAVAGQTLTITQTVGPSSWIVIRSGSPAGPIIASGTTAPSFTFLNTFTGTIYMHIYDNALSCGMTQGCDNFTIQCVSCPAANDLICGAQTITCGSTVTGTTVGAGADVAPTCVTTDGTGGGLWYKMTAAPGTIITMSMCGSAYDTKIRVYSTSDGTCTGTLACVTGNDDFCGLQSQISFTATAVPGGNYYILVHGFSSATGAFTLNTTCILPTPCSAAVNIPACGTTPITANFGAVTGMWNTTNDCGFADVGEERVFTFTPASTGNYLINVSSATNGFYDIGVRSSACAQTGWTCISGGGLLGSGTFSLGLLNSGTQYSFYFDKETAVAGSVTFTLPCSVAAPPNDLGCSVVPFPITVGTPHTFTGNTVGCTSFGDGAFNFYPTVWEAIILPSCATVQLNYCATSPAFGNVWLNLALDCGGNTVYSGVGSFVGCGNGDYIVTFSSVPAGTYWIPIIGEDLIDPGFIVTPGPYSLTVNTIACPPAPPNDIGCNVVPFPLTVGVPHTFTGNTVGCTTNGDGAFTSYPTVWEAIILPACATVELNYCATSPPFGNVWLNLATNCQGTSFIGGASFVGCGNGNFIVTFPNLPAGTYWIPIIGEDLIDPGFIVTPGPYVLTVNTTACPPPSPNQSCATALPIVCGGSVSGSSTGVAPSAMPGCDVNPGNNVGLWYVFNTSNPGGGIITVTTCNSGTNYDTYLKLFSGSCASLTCLAQNDDDGTCATGPGTPFFKSTLTWTAAANTNYYIFVTGFFNSTGLQQLNASCVLCTNPANGGTASGPATAPCTNSQINLTLAGYSGSIQWQVSSDGGATWNNIPGATTDNIFTSFPTLGSYMVRASVSSGSPGCGPSFSNILTYNVVNTADLLTATATPNPVCPGATLTLTSTSTAAFAPVPGTGTIVPGVGDDVVVGPFNIGFNFNFFGVNKTQFWIGSNGFITFTPNGSGCCTGGFIPSNDFVNDVIALAWEDLYPPNGGTISYFTTGVAGSQKLVVNYTNIQHFFSGNPVTMQVVLSETSNFIDINITSMPSDGGFHTEGVENAAGTVGQAVTGRNSQNWSATNDTKHFEPMAIPANGYTISNGAPGGGFLSYSWSGPGGYNAVGQNPPPIASMAPTGFGTYQITGTAANGCLANAFVIVNPLPSPVPTASNSSPVCDGTSLQLFGGNSAGQSPNTFSWTGPGFGPVVGQNPVRSVTPLAGAGPYIVTVTNSFGCTETASTIVTVNPNPVLSITSVTNEVCVGAQDGCIDVDASNGSPTYVYDLNGNSTLDGNYCGLGAGIYNVTVIDDNSCEGSINVTVNQEDNVDPTIICPPTVTVNTDAGVCYATGVNLGNPVYADNCGGLLGIANNAPVQYPQGGVIVQWEVTDLEGNKASCNQTVAVMDIEPPVALCKNICVYLGSNGLATITGADIDNGSHDNCGIASLTASPASFSFVDAGPNTVTLTVLDVNGNSSTCTATVTVGEYYTLFGAGPTCSTPSGQPDACHVHIGNGNNVSGNVGSYRSITTGGGVVINGNVYSGGKVNFANGVASKSVAAANLLGLPGLIFQTGNSASITGDVNVQGNININANAGSFVTGVVRHPVGTTYAGPLPGGGVLLAPPVLPALPGMPPINAYSCGGANITTTATLSPGSYGNITLGNPAGVVITFAGPGNYYFSRISMGQGGIHTFKYDFLGLPGKINIFVCGDIDFGTHMSQWANPNTPDACRVYFESHGTGSTNGTNSNKSVIIALGSQFYGRVWAPYGGISIGSGSCCTYATGSFWSGTQVHLEGAVTINRCGSTCPPGPRIGQDGATAEDMKDMLQVYPNPTTGQTTVSFFAETPDNYSLKVMDYQGRVVLSNQIKSIAGDNTLEVDMSQFAKGLYLIEVGNADHSQKVKLVVQ